MIGRCKIYSLENVQKNLLEDVHKIFLSVYSQNSIENVH